MKDLSNTYVNKYSGLCCFWDGPLGRLKTNLDSVVNPYDFIRLQDANNWFFGNVKNERK